MTRILYCCGLTIFLLHTMQLFAPKQRPELGRQRLAVKNVVSARAVLSANDKAGQLAQVEIAIQTMPAICVRESCTMLDIAKISINKINKVSKKRDSGVAGISTSMSILMDQLPSSPLVSPAGSCNSVFSSDEHCPSPLPELFPELDLWLRSENVLPSVIAID